MFQDEVTFTFILETIAVLLICTAVGIFLVKNKENKIKKGKK